MKRVLILYYSYEGNTHRLAEHIHNNLDYDIFRLEPKDEMNKRGFSKYIFGGKAIFMKEKPVLKPINVDLEKYDTIIIGTPVWAWTFAPPIRTVIDNGLIKNKKIYYLYTHEGGNQFVEKRAKKAFEAENNLVSCMGVCKVSKNFDKIKDKLIEWAKKASI